MENQDVAKFGRVGVLMGGYSSERDISLKSGRAVVSALSNQGFDVVAIDIIDKETKAIINQIQSANIDTAFIALHGPLGEDGVIQGVCEQLRIAYTGSGVQASRLAINKVLTQTFLKGHGMPVADFTVLNKEDQFDEEVLKNRISEYPVFIKPATEGSSIGISYVQKPEDLLAACDLGWMHSDTLIAETFVKGRELTVGVLGNKALSVVEIIPEHEYFDFTCKYEKGKTNYCVPAKISSVIACELQELALNVHRHIGCNGFSRVDFILDENHQPVILEINTIPGFTQTSLLPMAALNDGLTFEELTFQILELANGSKKEKKNIPIRN